MHPEFPPAFGVNAYVQQAHLARREDSRPCSMLLLGQPCGNHAELLFIAGYDNGARDILAVCDECESDWNDHHRGLTMEGIWRHANGNE